MAETGGVFPGGGLLSASNLEADVHPLVTIIAGLLWFVLIFAYAAVLMVNIRPSIAGYDHRNVWVELLGLIGVNLMIVVTRTGWQALIGDPYEFLGLGAKCLIFGASYAFFLLFFAPPRLV